MTKFYSLKKNDLGLFFYKKWTKYLEYFKVKWPKNKFSAKHQWRDFTKNDLGPLFIKNYANLFFTKKDLITYKIFLS